MDARISMQTIYQNAVIEASDKAIGRPFMSASE